MAVPGERQGCVRRLIRRWQPRQAPRGHGEYAGARARRAGDVVHDAQAPLWLRAAPHKGAGGRAEQHNPVAGAAAFLRACTSTLRPPLSLNCTRAVPGHCLLISYTVFNEFRPWTAGYSFRLLDPHPWPGPLFISGHKDASHDMPLQRNTFLLGQGRNVKAQKGAVPHSPLWVESLPAVQRRDASASHTCACPLVSF